VEKVRIAGGGKEKIGGSLKKEILFFLSCDFLRGGPAGDLKRSERE